MWDWRPCRNGLGRRRTHERWRILHSVAGVRTTKTLEDRYTDELEENKDSCRTSQPPLE